MTAAQRLVLTPPGHKGLTGPVRRPLPPDANLRWGVPTDTSLWSALPGALGLRTAPVPRASCTLYDYTPYDLVGVGTWGCLPTNSLTMDRAAGRSAASPWARRSALRFPVPGQVALSHRERGRAGYEKRSPGISISERFAVRTEWRIRPIMRLDVTPSVRSIGAIVTGAPGDPRGTQSMQRARRSFESRYSCTVSPSMR